MATRSYRSIVQEHDPDWQQEKNREPAYAFSNGRVFEDRLGSTVFAAKWNTLNEKWDHLSLPWGA